MLNLILLSAVSISLIPGLYSETQDWWKTMSLYQIYPRSFKDSDGDGVGDLRGIINELEYLSESDINAFWLSPIYRSPMIDFGYDISNFVDIDPIYGTMDDFQELTRLAHEKNIKVIIDLVPNHSSDEHHWFQNSLKMIEPYTDYYIWHKGKMLDDGTVTVPNNWVSVFGGPAWTWREERKAYYFHQFATAQPDLNYNNKYVMDDIKNVMRFWLDKGVDGFRVDAVPSLYEDPRFLDEPLSGKSEDPNDWNYLNHIYVTDQDRTYDIVQDWSHVLDEYKAKDGRTRVMMLEVYANISMTMKYYKFGANFPFNFGFITRIDQNSSAADLKDFIDTWMSNMPSGSVPNWVAGNHDNRRLVTRFGPERARIITLMTLVLPGVAVTYNGEEIGMEDTWISYQDTKDPQGIIAGEKAYEFRSRDPARTPFQWNDSLSAGFSSNANTWLPVNSNYKTLNLAAEKVEQDSYYNFYKKVSALRRLEIMKEGRLITNLYDDVLVLSRELPNKNIVHALINYSDDSHVVDIRMFDRVSKKMQFYCSSNGEPVENDGTVQVPGLSAVIYIGVEE